MLAKPFFPLAVLFLLGVSCNKVIEEVPLPPFEVFPNPCKDRVFIIINNISFAGDSVSIRLLDGNQTLFENTVFASGSFNLDMSDKAAGVYQVEVTGKGQTFTAPVLKVD